jgi:hypothetical protein
MIQIHKRALPDGVTITKPEDYRSGVVWEMLMDDCHGKCYICEDCVHTAPNVEHRVSHRGNPALKFDWNNLLLACSHCNNTKLDKYDDMIDPITTDPEQVIELSLDVDDELRETVLIQKIAGGSEVDVTVNLLDAVYNAARPDMKRSACQQLKNKISKDLVRFQQTLERFQKQPTSASRALIEEELSDASLFAAFKRGMIRGNPELSAVFGHSHPYKEVPLCKST